MPAPVSKVSKDPLDLRDPPGRRGLTVRKDQRVTPENEDLKAILANEVRRVRRVRPVRREAQAVAAVLQELKDRRGIKAPRVQLETRDLLVIKGLEETKVSGETRDLLELLDPQALKDCKDLEG